MNLAASTSTPYSSLNRSESSSNLLSSSVSLSPVPVSDIRGLTYNYQATRDIKRSNLHLHTQNMEQGQEKISQNNVDLTWKKEKQDLIKANDEFTTEVERLHKVEEEKIIEIENLQNQILELHAKFSELNLKHFEKENKLMGQIVELTESLSTANEQSTRILEKVKSVEESYENDEV